MKINQELKHCRKKLGLTQEQVAEKIFVSQKSVSNWETGKTYPDIDSLIRLAHLYDLSLDNLLLEGSDIVKNIKKQAELKTTQKYLAAPFLTNLTLFFVYSTQGLFGELALPVILALAFGGLCNVITIIYFLAKINDLEEKNEEELKSENKRALLWTAVLGILFVAVALILYLLFT